MAAETIRVLELDDRPATRRAWWSDLWRHREVLAMLAKADFHVRYKRAAFGVIWAVVVPLVQAVVLAVVFSRIIRVGTGSDFAAYVLSGVLPWSYFGSTLSAGSTAVVDGAGLTDKVWFPRAMLPMVPAMANLVGLGISVALLVIIGPFLGADIGPRLLFLPLAVVLLVTFTVSLSTVLAALHVYFRDVRFLVQAAMLVWFYLTPIAYPLSLLGGLAKVLVLNPMTGVISLFRLALVGQQPHQWEAVGVSAGTTLVLAVIALEAYRRHDRLFVDKL